MGSQLILSIFILFIMFRTWHSYQTKKMSKSFSVCWVLLWMIGLFVIFYPGFLQGIAQIIGVGRGVDFALYISIILLFYLIYKINLKIVKLIEILQK